MDNNLKLNLPFIFYYFYKATLKQRVTTEQAFVDTEKTSHAFLLCGFQTGEVAQASVKVTLLLNVNQYTI